MSPLIILQLPNAINATAPNTTNPNATLRQ